MSNTILLTITAVALIIAGIVAFYLADKKKAKEWLLYAVTLAEKELGSGTGRIKLRQVYDAFLEKFPVFSRFVPFETFSSWVDEALELMKQMLRTNEATAKFVGIK